MAYRLFGLTPADFTTATFTVSTPSGTDTALKPQTATPLEAWTAGTAGSQVTDLLLFTGDYTTPGAAAPSGIFNSLVDGTVAVWAQDTVAQLWVTGQGSSGQRWLLRPVDEHGRLLAVEAASYIPASQKAAADGVASLGSDGKVPSAQLPTLASGVTSVNTLTGAVTLSEANTGFVPNSRTVSPGSGLTGGGSLTQNRTLSVQFGTTAGTVAEGNHTHGGFTTSPRPVFAQVISNDAPTEWKTAAAADPYTWVCDGTNDETEINLAIDAASPLQSRNAAMPATAKQLGMVQLSGGRFNIGSGGIAMRTAVHLNGAGIAATEVRAVSCNQVGMIRLAAGTDHICHVSNMWLNGNSSSGGTCSAIDFDMSTGSSTSGYPDTNADAYHHIHDLFIDEFTANTSRHGIYLHAGSSPNNKNRANMIDRIQIRGNYTNAGGVGIYLSAASDSFIMNCHVGEAGTANYRIATGNTKIANCKSFYGNTYGFWFDGSGRGTVTGCESQDDDTGYYFDGAPYTCAALTADTSNVAGMRVSTNDLQLNSFSIFNRSGGRYATQTRGLWYDGTYTDLNLTGQIVPTSITTPVSGAPGSRSFARYSNGTSLIAVG